MSFLLTFFANPSKILPRHPSSQKVAVRAVGTSSTATSSDHCISHESQSRRMVTFHPTIVTDVRLRPSVSEEEKFDLFFSRRELQRCRDAERAQLIQIDTMSAMIQGQQKYQRCHGNQGNEPTVISKVSIMQQ
jgi:hypothetical protein